MHKKKLSLLEMLARAGADAVTEVISAFIQALPDKIFDVEEKPEEEKPKEVKDNADTQT